MGCKSGSSEPAALKTDSSVISLPAPQKISNTELSAYHNKLTELFDSKLIHPNFNGAVLVAKGGNILYEKYAGFTDPKSKAIPITDSSSFHLASTSKPFTGVAILRLVQQGKIGLNDDITLFFPAFPYEGVTVKDLLSHRSGLPNYLYFMDDKEKWPAGKMVSNKDVLHFLIQYKPDLSYRTGSRFSYCNTNYVLLALIIEKVTGKSYPEYMKQTIFGPLGMKHTFVYNSTDAGRVIMSYKPSGALWEQDIFDDTYGDKNIYSTPRDLLKWDAALYSEQFIRQSLLDSAYHPLSNERPSIHNYGLGWRILNLPNGKHVIYHNGKWHGFTPAFARLIDEKAVIIILGNKYNAAIYKTAKMAYNVFGDYMQNDMAVEEDAVATAPALPVAPKPIVMPKKKEVVRPLQKQPASKKEIVRKSTTQPVVPKTRAKQEVKKNTKQPVKKQTTPALKKQPAKRKKAA
ncbi:serine hydrolase domain-containing protein [Niabella aquatica]